MARKEKPPCQYAVTWVRERLGRRCFAPFTGQDWPAYTAWIHLLELYFRADIDGRARALEAMRAVLHAMQPSCWIVAKASIPAVGDWSHEEEIWSVLGVARVEGDNVVQLGLVARALVKK